MNEYKVGDMARATVVAAMKQWDAAIVNRERKTKYLPNYEWSQEAWDGFLAACKEFEIEVRGAVYERSINGTESCSASHVPQQIQSNKKKLYFTALYF